MKLRWNDGNECVPVVVSSAVGWVTPDFVTVLAARTWLNLGGTL